MRTHRDLRMIAGVVLAAASLVVGTMSTGFARPAQSGAAARGPNPKAPRGALVRGLQTGRHISVNTPANTRRFQALHRRMRNALHGKAGSTSIHEYVGTSFDDLAGFNGAQATQSVS